MELENKPRALNGLVSAGGRVAGGRQRGGLPGQRLRAGGAAAGARPAAPALRRAGARAPLLRRAALGHPRSDCLECCGRFYFSNVKCIMFKLRESFL